MGKRAPVLFATVVACLSLVGVVAAQSGAPRPATDFGRSIASYFDEREYGELAELFMTHEDTCPLSTPGGLLPICEGVAEGETVNGYIVAQMGSDASLATRETLIEGLEFLHDQAYEGRDGWRLFTVGLDGVPYGYTACDGCEVVVISRTDLAETTGELIMFQVMEVDGELRIWSMTNGSTDVTGSQALLKGGMFEMAKAETMATTEPAMQKENMAGDYVIKPGDSLWTIAREKYGDALEWKRIETANSVKNVRRLQIGDTLVIPQ